MASVDVGDVFSSATPKGSPIDLFSPTHEYKGVTLPGTQPPEVLEALKKWETRPDDVYVFTYPKSGTHWIGEIVFLIMNDVDLEKIDRSHMVIGLDLALTHDGDGWGKPGHEVIAKWSSPRIIGGHILEEFTPQQIKELKVIYFSRNPKDVCVSYFKFLGSSLPDWIEGWKGFVPYFLSDKMFHGSWFRHVKGWFSHKDRPNILLCKYEDFHQDLRASVKRVADFLGRPLSEEKLDKMVELTEMKGMKKTYQDIEDKEGYEGKLFTRLFAERPFLMKGKVGGWKDEFTVAQNEYFDKIYKQEMDGSGIEFQFEL